MATCEPRLTATAVESPLPGDRHGGFGERPGETGRWQHRNRAPGRLNKVMYTLVAGVVALAVETLLIIDLLPAGPALSHAGARAVVTDLAELTTALRAAPSPALPN